MYKGEFTRAKEQLVWRFTQLCPGLSTEVPGVLVIRTEGRLQVGASKGAHLVVLLKVLLQKYHVGMIQADEDIYLLEYVVLRAPLNTSNVLFDNMHLHMQATPAPSSK